MRWLALVALFAATNPQAAIQESDAIAAADALKTKLTAHLAQAMSNQDAPAALRICAAEAPKLTADIGKQFNLEVTRITDKPRNPNNRGTQAEIALLNKIRGDEVLGVKKPFYELDSAYYFPLHINQLCLNCHGAAIAPDILTAIRDHYPEDQAKGYSQGELRGAIRVRAVESKAE